MYFCLQLTAALCMAALLTVSSGADDWDYGTYGPKYWLDKHKQFCAGDKQSPINLGIQHSKLDSKIKPFLVVQNTSANDIEFTLQNNGHSVKLTWSEALSIRMGISANSLTHTAVQMHWHWGADDRKGSEHTVDNTAFPAEGHLVFYNNNYYNFSNAADKGLAVLGVLYEVSEKENPLLELIKTALSNDSIAKMNDTVSFNVSGLNYLNVMSSLFLPTNTEEFYRYDGSLTTPPCYESVLWTVYRQKVPISKDQLKLFRRLQFPNNASMADNFRSPLPLNPASIWATPRVLYRTFDASRASTIASVPFVAFAMVAVATQRFTAAVASSSI